MTRPHTYTEALDDAPEARGLVPEVEEIETGYNGIVGDPEPEDLDEDGEVIVW